MWRVKGWETRFENSRSRACDKLDWVPIPNKHDSDGYTALIDHEHGVSHYGAWCLLVQVASKCKPRGTLVRDGGKPHTADSLGRLTRVGAHVYREAIPRFIEVGWLESVDDGCLSGDRHAPVTERNGTEEKRRERSFVLASDQIEIWGSAYDVAVRSCKKLWPARPPKQEDRDLLKRAAILSLTVFTPEWLGDAIEATQRKAPRNRAAYLKTVLAETARRSGQNLNDLLDSVALPPNPSRSSLESRTQQAVTASVAEGLIPPKE